MKCRRLTIILCVLVLLPVSVRSARTVQAKEMLAGHWHLVFYGRCVLTAANLQACRDLQSPAEFPITSVPGATLIVIGVGQYIADARGHYTVHFTTTITERVPHGRQVRQCNNTVVFTTNFNGRCEEEGWGHGHIARGRTGMDDFWQDDAHGFWRHNPSAHFAESTTIDTLNPACAGTLNTTQFMALLGDKFVPSGITARLALTHRK